MSTRVTDVSGQPWPSREIQQERREGFRSARTDAFPHSVSSQPRVAVEPSRSEIPPAAPGAQYAVIRRTGPGLMPADGIECRGQFAK